MLIRKCDPWFTLMTRISWCLRPVLRQKRDPKFHLGSPPISVRHHTRCCQRNIDLCNNYYCHDSDYEPESNVTSSGQPCGPKISRVERRRNTTGSLNWHFPSTSAPSAEVQDSQGRIPIRAAHATSRYS